MAGAAKKPAGNRGGGKAAAPALSNSAGAAKKPADEKPADGRRPDMLKSGVKLEELEGQGLKDYAKSCGVPGHVIDSMTDEKLRRECLFRVQQFLDDLDD